MTVFLWIVGIIGALWIWAKINRWSKARAARRRALEAQQRALQAQHQKRAETLAMLSSPDPTIRGQAIDRLEKNNDALRVVALAKDELAGTVRVAAYKQLRKWNEVKATCDLIDYYAGTGGALKISDLLSEWWGGVDKPPGSTIFDRGINAIVRMGGADAFLALMHFYGNKNLSTQCTKGILPLFLGQPQLAAAKAVEYLTDDPGRVPVLELLGTLKQASAIPFLKGLVDSDKPAYIVSPVLNSLAEIGGAESVSAVASALGHTDAAIRRAACSAMAKMHADAPAVLITRVLSDSDEAVRLIAVRALSHYGDECLGALGEVFERDSSINVRFEAAAILCAKGHALARDTVFKELLRQATLDIATCSPTAIERVCSFFSCGEDYALARLALHIPTTSRVSGRSSQPFGGNYYSDELQPEASLKALRELCLKKSAFATEVLKIIAGRQSVTVRLSSCNTGYDQNVDLSAWQQEARQELIKRGVQA